MLLLLSAFSQLVLTSVTSKLMNSQQYLWEFSLFNVMFGNTLLEKWDKTLSSSNLTNITSL